METCCWSLIGEPEKRRAGGEGGAWTVGVEGQMKECYKRGRGPMMSCNTHNAAIENHFHFILELIAGTLCPVLSRRLRGGRSQAAQLLIRSGASHGGVGGVFLHMILNNKLNNKL